MGSDLSFIAGSVLLVAAIMVVKEYWPSKIRGLKPPDMLRFGIFLGFFLTACNTLFWQVTNTIVVSQGLMTSSEFQAMGKWLDVPLKGGMAVVALIHLKAKQMMKADYDSRT